MSKATGTAATDRKSNRFDPEDFAGVLAPKGGATGTVTGADPRSLPDAKSGPATSQESAAAVQPVRKRYSTSLDFPDYVDEQITTWLRGHPEHVFKTMILHALSKIGLEIKPEDLVPQRRRRR